MAVKIYSRIDSAEETIARHASYGWQCPECYGVQVNTIQNRFGGRSEDKFECQECGCNWSREGE